MLFVGRLLPEKGVGLLLAARDPEFDLVFCGPGDASLLGMPLPPGVEYFPARPTAELVSLYHAADLLVVPSSLREGFPLVIQEALACGLPVVTCHDPGYEPYRRLTSFLLCRRDVASLRQAIQQALGAMAKRSAKEAVPGLAEMFPEPQVWLECLYAGLADGAPGAQAATLNPLAQPAKPGVSVVTSMPHRCPGYPGECLGPGSVREPRRS